MSEYIEELEIDRKDFVSINIEINKFERCREKHKRLVDLLDSGNVNANYVLQIKPMVSNEYGELVPMDKCTSCYSEYSPFSTIITELNEDDIEDIEDVASKTGFMAECIKRTIDEVEETARDHRKDILYMWNKLSEKKEKK